MLAISGSGDDARQITTSGFQGSGNTQLGQLATEDEAAVSADLRIVQSGNSSYSGTFTGSGELTKSGVGSLKLTGANTYTGKLNVAAGTVDLNGGNLEDSLEVTIESGARFIANTAGEVIGNVTNRGRVDVNSGLTTADLTNSATMNLSATLAADDIVNSGTLTQSGSAATITAESFSNLSSDTTNLRANVTLTAVDGYDAITGALAGSGRYDQSGVTNVLEDITLTTTGLSSETYAASLDSGSPLGLPRINITDDKTLTVVQSGDSTYSGALQGDQSDVDKQGSGTLTLSGLVDIATLIITEGM
jgi:autotransporter-associated beta strand repeat